MSNIISIRLTDEQIKLLKEVANKFSCTPTAFARKSLGFILEDMEYLEKHFSNGSNLIQAKGDFLSDVGASPFYGTGRNTFYSFGNGEKKCFLFSTSRTISKRESLIVTLDGTKISEFIEICKQNETVGYIAIRFRLSTDEEWKYVLSQRESLIVTLDGTKISEFIEICKQNETVGYIAIRFRLSTDEEWKYVLSPVSKLNSSPFSKSSSTGNYFFHLSRALPKDILNNLDLLKEELEEGI